MMTERKKRHNYIKKKRKVVQTGVKTGKMITVRTHIVAKRSDRHDDREKENT
jgi:hypothetical protein